VWLQPAEACGYVQIHGNEVGTENVAQQLDDRRELPVAHSATLVTSGTGRKWLCTCQNVSRL
jgi:hypothetical protein